MSVEKAGKRERTGREGREEILNEKHTDRHSDIPERRKEKEDIEERKSRANGRDRVRSEKWKEKEEVERGE